MLEERDGCLSAIHKSAPAMTPVRNSVRLPLSGVSLGQPEVCARLPQCEGSAVCH